MKKLVAFNECKSFIHLINASILVNFLKVLITLFLQDLNQPKLEANLPDGLLSVPLLRHQVFLSECSVFLLLSLTFSQTFRSTSSFRKLH